MPRVLLGYASDCCQQVRALLSSPEPVFLSRLGGSDTDLLVAFHELARQMPDQEALARLPDAVDLVRRYNGYYDKRNDPANVARYCRAMIDAYTGCPEVVLVGSAWLTGYFPDSINRQFHVDLSANRSRMEAFLRAVSPSFLRLYPYTFIENTLHGETLFRVFGTVLQGKKVLVICPFERSIRANFPRRRGFFPGYAYPEFDLCTVNTPITYAGLPDALYPHSDWFETLEALKAQVAAQDFDIALMACGSYAMPLGRFVTDSLRRKAVYVGGVLQLYFGIMGRRYDNPFFTGQINPDAFIYPLERDDFLRHMTITDETAREAFGAYF